MAPGVMELYSFDFDASQTSQVLELFADVSHTVNLSTAFGTSLQWMARAVNLEKLSLDNCQQSVGDCQQCEIDQFPPMPPTCHQFTDFRMPMHGRASCLFEQWHRKTNSETFGRHPFSSGTNPTFVFLVRLRNVHTFWNAYWFERTHARQPAFCGLLV